MYIKKSKNRRKPLRRSQEKVCGKIDLYHITFEYGGGGRS